MFTNFNISITFIFINEKIIHELLKISNEFELEITGIEPIFYECKSYILPTKLYLQN